MGTAQESYVPGEETNVSPLGTQVRDKIRSTESAQSGNIPVTLDGSLDQFNTTLTDII